MKGLLWCIQVKKKNPRKVILFIWMQYLQWDKHWPLLANKKNVVSETKEVISMSDEMFLLLINATSRWTEILFP